MRREGPQHGKRFQLSISSGNVDCFIPEQRSAEDRAVTNRYGLHSRRRVRTSADVAAEVVAIHDVQGSAF